VNGAYVLDDATKAMIAALDSQEERDRLTRFFTVDLREGKGTGILGDVFLILKANRCYMEKLPGQFNRELVQPITENMLRLETTIGLQNKAQKEGLARFSDCANSAISAAQRMETVVPKVDKVVQGAFDKIDTASITKKITDTVVQGAVEPVAKVNEKCDELQAKLERRAAILAPLMQWGTLLNLGLWASGVALALTVVGYIIVDNFHRDMTTQLQDRVAQEIEQVHATTQVNEETLETLAKLNVEIIINPEKDWLGNLMPNHYCLAIKGADSGETINKDGDKYGAIFFKEQITDIPLYPDH